MGVVMSAYIQAAHDNVLKSFAEEKAAAIAEERYEDAATAKAKADVVRKMFSAILPFDASPPQ